MKKSLLTTSLLLAFASTSAFAHHPAADRVDPEIYAMIDENVSDTPHADLTFDDMGRDADVVEQSADLAEETRGNMAEAAREAESFAESGSMELRGESVANMDDMPSSDDMVDTIGMLDSVESQLAE